MDKGRGVEALIKGGGGGVLIDRLTRVPPVVSGGGSAGFISTNARVNLAHNAIHMSTRTSDRGDQSNRSSTNMWSAQRLTV